MSDLDSLVAELESLETQSSPKEKKQKRGKAPKEKKRKSKAVIALVLLLLVLLGLIAGIFYYFLVYSAKDPLAREGDALGGELAGKTPTQMQEILNEKIEEGEVLIGIASEPIFEYGGKKGRIGIENDVRNNYSFQVTLRLSETGEELYSSGVIDPGYYVEFIELNQTLESGDYTVTALFTTYSLTESPDPIAEIQADITLHVTDGEFYR